MLVADDDGDIRRFVDYLLRLAGYDVIPCPDGRVALEAAEEHRPDLLLLDIGMPGLTGVQVCEKVIESMKEEAPPVVFLTAHGGTDNRLRGLGAGAADYITKPFSKNELIARVGAALANHGEASAA